MITSTLQACERYLFEAYGEPIHLTVRYNPHCFGRQLWGEVDGAKASWGKQSNADEIVVLPRWQCLIDPQSQAARRFLQERVSAKWPPVAWAGRQYCNLLAISSVRRMIVPWNLRAEPDLPSHPAPGTNVTGLGDLVLGDYTNRVKVFSFSEGRLLNLARTPAHHGPLRQEVRGRKAAIAWGVSAPPVLASQEDGGWSLEPLVPGRPLRDLNNTTWPVVASVFRELMGQYRGSGCSWVDGETYLQDCLRTLRQGIHSVGPQGEALAPRLAVVEDWLTSINSACDRIAVTAIHGDFHLDNILWDSKEAKAWLIDWEYSREGPVWADLYWLLAAWSRWRGAHLVWDWICKDPSLPLRHPNLVKMVDALERLAPRPTSLVGQAAHFGLVLLERCAATIERVASQGIHQPWLFPYLQSLFEMILEGAQRAPSTFMRVP